MSRRRSAIIAATVAAVGLVYGGLWLYAAGRLTEGVERWAAERRAQGWQVKLGGVSATGFPFRLAVVIPAPALARSRDGRFWRGPPVTLYFRPWQPDMVEAGFPGTHFFGTSPARAQDGIKLKVGRAKAWLHAAANGDDVQRRIDLMLGDLVLPDGVRAPLGQTIEKLELSATVKGPHGPDRDRDAMAAWRDGGGVVELPRLALDWAALSLSADGTLALDRNLQPEAALSARFTGFKETVDALVSLGKIRPRNGMTAKIVLGLLEKRPAGGGPPQITAPLTIQAGKLYIGPVQLLSLPKIDWGN